MEGDGMNITPAQIKKIHTLVKLLELSDDNYRALLYRFNVESSKDFSKDEASAFIDELTSIYREQILRNSDIKPTGTQLKGRLTYFDRTKKASDKQIDYIAGLWLKLSDEKNYQSLMWFIKRITGKLYIHIESLNITETRKVINALKSWDNNSNKSTHR